MDIKSQIKTLGLEEVTNLWRILGNIVRNFDYIKNNGGIRANEFILDKEFWDNINKLQKEEIDDLVKYSERVIESKQYDLAVAEKRVLVIKGLENHFSYDDIEWALNFDRAEFRVTNVIPIKDDYSYVILDNAYIVKILFFEKCCENEIVNGTSIRKVRSAENGIIKMIEITKHKHFRL